MDCPSVLSLIASCTNYDCTFTFIRLSITERMYLIKVYNSEKLNLKPQTLCIQVA